MRALGFLNCLKGFFNDADNLSGGRVGGRTTSTATRFPPATFMLFSGGLMLGAVFMATDMVSSPVTPWGVWIYGAFIGVLVIIIRLFGGLPEGVAYAIVLANSIVPILNQLTKPRAYGVNTLGR